MLALLFIDILETCIEGEGERMNRRAVKKRVATPYFDGLLHEGCSRAEFSDRFTEAFL